MLSGKTYNFVSDHHCGRSLMISFDEVLDHVLQFHVGATLWEHHHIPHVDDLGESLGSSELGQHMVEQVAVAWHVAGCNLCHSDLHG